MGRKSKYKKTSKFHGIHYEKHNNKWKAYSKDNTYLGYYNSEPDAIKAQQENTVKPRSSKYRTKGVNQCNQYLELINSFNSVSEASQATNTNPTSIRLCCNYQQLTANNCNWFWTDDTITEILKD